MTRPALVALALVAAVGCSKSKSDPAPTTCGTHAPVVTATASPTSVEPGGGLVQLTATSTDADDGCLAAPEARTYRWRIESRPPSSSAVLSDPVSAAPTLAPDVPGDYQLEVVALDAAGHASAPDFVTVAATSCNLITPTASVAGPIAGTLWNAVTLPAPTVTDGNCRASGAVSYRWTLVARPAGSSAVLSEPTAQRPVLVPDRVGPYQVSLVVTDSVGMTSAAAFVTVNVSTCGTAAPALPALTASPALPNAGDLVTLGLGGAIVDANVACGGAAQPYAYRWTLLSTPPGSAAVLAGEDSAAPRFVPDVPGGTYQLALVVTDALGNVSPPAFLQVQTSGCGALLPVLGGPLSFSPSPRANLAFTATAPAAADGNAACPPRFTTPVTTYTFSIVSKPAGAVVQLVQDGSATASISASQGGSYGVQVVATSSAGLTSSPLVTIVPVSGCGAFPPVASAFTLSQAVPSGSGVDAVSDTPATVGAGLAAGGAASSAAGFYVGAPVTVSAAVGDADSSGVTCASFAIPPQPVTYGWSLVQVPAGSRASLGLASGPAVAFTPDVPGTYGVSLTTADSAGNASTSTVTLSAPCGGSPPAIVAISGSQGGLVTPSPLAVTAPISLGAVVVDPDGSAAGACGVAEAQPITYAWSFTRLPPGSHASLAGAATATPSFVPDVATNASGAEIPYELSLTVTDPQGHHATARLAVTVTCDAAPPAVATVPGTSVPDFTVTQQVPGVLLAGQGTPSTLTLTRGSAPGSNRASVGGIPVLTSASFYPGVPVQLAANVPASQTSAGCAVYPQAVTSAWSLRALPPGSAATLTGASGPTPSFVPDLPGTYAFELVLTDQHGRTSRTVLATDVGGAAVAQVGVCGRQAPIAVARVAEPIASTPGSTASAPLGLPLRLDGSASQSPDASPFLLDGSGGCGLLRPLTYAWSLESAPAGSSAVLSAAVATPSIVLDLLGSYTLRLSVGDGTSVASTLLAIQGLGGYPSSPAPTGPVFTATAVDGTGLPVVAWWDNASGSVGAARCTSGCDTASPTWTSLGTVDSGLGTLTFAPEDEPRPVAVAVSGSTTYVAYYTSTGVGTAGAHGMPSCAAALAVHDGSAWVRWTHVASPYDYAAPFASCTAEGSAPFVNFESGRWLSLAMRGGVPVVGLYTVTGPSQTELDDATCAGADCSSFTSRVVDQIAGAMMGRWNTLAVDALGALHAVHRVDTDGAGSRGVRWVADTAGTIAGTTLETSATIDAGRFTSIAVLPAGAGPETLAVAYADSTAKRVKVVRIARGGGGWVAGAPAVVAEAAGVDAGQGVVVAAAPSAGSLRLAYLDATGGFLRLAASADGTTFSTIAQVPITTAPGAPLGLSIASGSRTFLSFSRTGTGPAGAFTAQ